MRLAWFRERHQSAMAIDNLAFRAAVSRPWLLLIVGGGLDAIRAATAL